ncbi:MAG: IS1595 family transposase, partial [Planctomycetia bacterium]|nr:IS1595 family transposase [Planctomycetia bacterium]
MSLVELAQQYDTDSKCIALLESLRWPNGPSCPNCESKLAYRIKERMLYECGDCAYQYSVTAGTIMHRSHIPLTKWILAAALICNARKGVSACQLARDLHVTYKTAWYLGHRLRRAMRETAWLTKFTGVVEVDESYLGGKSRGGKRGRGAPNKTVVFGVKERGGEVRMNCIPNITAETIEDEVRKFVDTDAEMVVADQLNSYNQLAAEFTMERIDHSRECLSAGFNWNFSARFCVRLPSVPSLSSHPRKREEGRGSRGRGLVPL